MPETRWEQRTTCAGSRVGAIAGSTNLALAETFSEVECVPFDGVSDDVFGDMLRALMIGEVDAVVDDDVAFIGIEGTHPGIRVAFTVPHPQPLGVRIAPRRRGAQAQMLDDGIAQADLQAVWRCWLPSLTYPLWSPFGLRTPTRSCRRPPRRAG